MEYKAYLKQAGEGCDYTIGCGLQVIDIEASNLDEARRKLLTLIIEDYSYDENLLESVELYEINTLVKIDPDLIYSKLDEEKFLIEEQEKEDKERMEYERLKNKFA